MKQKHWKMLQFQLKCREQTYFKIRAEVKVLKGAEVSGDIYVTFKCIWKLRLDVFSWCLASQRGWTSSWSVNTERSWGVFCPFTHTDVESLSLRVDAHQEVLSLVGVPVDGGHIFMAVDFKDLVQTVSDENQLGLHLGVSGTLVSKVKVAFWLADRADVINITNQEKRNLK